MVTKISFISDYPKNFERDDRQTRNVRGQLVIKVSPCRGICNNIFCSGEIGLAILLLEKSHKSLFCIYLPLLL